MQPHFPASLLTDDPIAAPEVAPESAPKVQNVPQTLNFHFSGNGREYFGIWIVNLMLTILTFGIYSAWAKVRRTQYFHAHTWLDQANFNYLGQPGAILRGRVVALVLLGGYTLAKELAPTILVVVVVALGIILPWLLRRSLLFRARHTLHRGLRFTFSGTTLRAYWVFLVWGIASFVSGLVLAPAAMQRVRHYQFNHLAFGDQAFAFTARVRQYYGIWFRSGLIWLGAVIALFFIFGVTLGFSSGLASILKDGQSALVTVATFLGAFWLTRAHYVAHLQNLIWNHTTLGGQRFISNAQVWPLFWIPHKNGVFTVATLGFYRPFAVINVTRYRLSRISFVATQPLDDIQARSGENASAVGEETADLFGVEFGL